jgi:hypothetical protein
MGVICKIRCEASRHFKNKMREYPKDKINEPAKNSEQEHYGNEYQESSCG